MAEQEQGDGFVAYRNTNTNTVHVLEGASAELDARPNFVRVDLDEVPVDALNEARRARADRLAIEASADINRLRVEVTGEEAARAAGAAATSTDDGGAVVVSTEIPPAKRTGAGAPDGVLSRPGVDDVQIGPNPEQHPKGQAALRAQARLDAEIPANVGVLARQHADGDPVSQEVPKEAREKGAELAEAAPNSGPQVHQPQTDPDTTDPGEPASKSDGDGEQGDGTKPADDAEAKPAKAAKAAPRKQAGSKATGSN